MTHGRQTEGRGAKGDGIDMGSTKEDSIQRTAITDGNVAVGRTRTQPVFSDTPLHAKAKVTAGLAQLPKPRMAKADVRSPDMTWRTRIGAAIQRAILAVWENNQLAAAELEVDGAEFGKWLSGTRRPQFDRLFAIERLREPLINELARMAGASVITHVEWHRQVG